MLLTSVYLQAVDAIGFTGEIAEAIHIHDVETRPWRIGDVVRKLRLEAGWTLPQMAAIAELNVAVINRIELGKTKEPKSATRSKIAGAFGLTPRELEDMVPHGEVRFERSAGADAFAAAIADTQDVARRAPKTERGPTRRRRKA